MLTPRYCEHQADICRLMAVEAACPEQSLEWLAMADDWRALARAGEAANDNWPGDPGRRHAAP